MILFNHKKGIIEIQLNWIFILIVGAIILLFFIFVSKSITTSAEVKTSEKILTNIDAILIGSSTTEKTASKIDIPKPDISYTCFADENACSPDYGCTSGFAYKKTGKKIDTSSLVIFSPEQITSSSLITWTQDWQVPFKVMNFLFLSRPDVKYILVADENNVLANELGELFKDNEFITVLKTNDITSQIINENDYWIRIVFFNQINPTTQNFDKLQAMHVDAAVVDENTQTITFYPIKQEKKLSKNNYYSQPLPYIDKISLLGAIFSEQPEHYVCNMNKALLRYHKVYDTIKTRAALIAQNIVTPAADKSACAFFYEGIDVSFTQPPSLNDGISAANIKTIISTLEEQNKNAIINSCPRIY